MRESQLIIVSSTVGDMVSSISRYSVTAPVLQCWKRWLTPSMLSIRFFEFDGRVLRRADRLLSCSTWISFDLREQASVDYDGSLFDYVIKDNNEIDIQRMVKSSWRN